MKDKGLKELLTQISDYLRQVQVYNVSWGGTTVTLRKRGFIVHGAIWNPRTVAAGDNIICTLPEGWRPVNDVVWTVHAPNSTSTNVDLRYTMNVNGLFKVYNYGAAWTNKDSNITESFVYIAQ